MNLLDLDDSDLTLGECVAAVRRFHKHIHAPIAEQPRTLFCRDSATALGLGEMLLESSRRLVEAASNVDDLLLLRAGLAVEELGEWIKANAEGDIVAAADAIGDRFYVLLGDAVAAGFPLEPIFEEIHDSNMTKTPYIQTGHGHGVKGPSYRPPNVARIVGMYRGNP